MDTQKAEVSAKVKEEVTASVKEEYRVYFDDFKAKFKEVDAEKDAELNGLKKKLADIDGQLVAKDASIDSERNQMLQEMQEIEEDMGNYKSQIQQQLGEISELKKTIDSMEREKAAASGKAALLSNASPGRGESALTE